MRIWRTKSGYEITQILSGRSNVFLLSNGKNNLLVDTSVARAWPRLKKKLDKLGIKTLDYLILTHTHFDHASNALRIREKFNSPVMVQVEEERYLSAGDNIIPHGTTFITKPLVNHFGKQVFKKFKYEPCKPDFLVSSIYHLNNSGFNAYLMHTPGHTAGSMSLIIDDEIALVGDSMFGVFKWSVFPPYAQDTDLMVKSWGKLLETKCSLFIPSHGTANSRSLVHREYHARIRRITGLAAE